MLRAAALSSRLRSLFWKSPTSSDAGLDVSFFCLLPDPVASVGPRLHRTPISPLFLPCAFNTSSFPSALCVPTPLSAARSSSHTPLQPSLSAFPLSPARPPPPRPRALPVQLFPNLFLFSPASPHHDFPLSAPRFSRPVFPPATPLLPGPDAASRGRGRPPSRSERRCPGTRRAGISLCAETPTVNCSPLTSQQLHDIGLAIFTFTDLKNEMKRG